MNRLGAAPPRPPMEKCLKEDVKRCLWRMSKGIMHGETYFGIPTWKSPMDAWVYQMIIHKHRPDVIVEVGNYCGGSALMMAHWLDQLNHGRIIAVDIYQDHIFPAVRAHPRISFLEGDGGEMAEVVKEQVKPGERVLVIEDSSHTYENTLYVLRSYASLIQPGDYMIVEDSIINNGIDRDHPGPGPAIETFVGENDEFEIDRSKELFFLTWNPKGFLRRRKGERES